MLLPLFAGSITTQAIYNAFAKTILSTASVELQRHIHLNHFASQQSQFRPKRLSASARKSMEKNLGITSQPKQPLPPYFRFMQQVRSSVKAEHPHLKPRELYTIIIERWKLLEAKEKELLSKEYRTDRLKYAQAFANYSRTVTTDDKRKIEQKLEEISGRRLVKSYQKRAQDLNKPKKPSSSFLRYLHAQTDRQPDEPYKEYMKRMSAKWQALSERKKGKYATTPEEMENYKKNLLAWEASLGQLIEAGGEDLLTTHTEDQGDDGYLEDYEFDDEDL